MITNTDTPNSSNAPYIPKALPAYILDIKAPYTSSMLCVHNIVEARQMSLFEGVLTHYM